MPGKGSAFSTEESERGCGWKEKCLRREYFGRDGNPGDVGVFAREPKRS